MDLAKSAPLKIETVSIDPITSAKGEYVFGFKAQYVLTEPLYKESGNIKCDDLDNSLQVLVALGIKSDPVVQKLQDIDQEIQRVKILKITMPVGTKGEIQGKSTAVINPNGSWGFDYTLTHGQNQNGFPAPTDVKWFIEGSKDIKTYQDELSHRVKSLSVEVDRVVAEAEQTKQRAAEEKKRAEEEKRAVEEKITAEKHLKEEKFLSIIAPESRLIGKWDAQMCGGKIGLRFGERLKNGSSYTLEGNLFDPSNPQNCKPFSATTSGDGSFEKPYTIHFALNSASGGVMISGNNNLYIEKVRFKTLGFLTADAHYEFNLKYNVNDDCLSGELGNSFMYHIPTFGNANANIVLFFNKQIKYHEETSNKVSSEQETGYSTNNLQEKSQTQSYDEIFITSKQRKVNRTPDIVHQENAQVLRVFADSFRTARSNKDIPRMKEIMKDVLARYPDTATTHYWLMNIAFLERNSEEVRKQHDILIKEFPETPELSVKRDQQYQECMKDLYQSP